MAAARDSPEVLQKRRIENEYAQWKLAQRLLVKLKQRTEQFTLATNDYQVEKIFGRWLMFMQHCNWEQLDERFPLFPRPPPNDDRSKEELVRMLTEDAFTDMTQDVAQMLADEQLWLIDRFFANHHGTHNYPIVAAVAEFLDSVDMDFIVVGTFNAAKCDRIRDLIEKTTLVKTTLVTMRYDSLSLFLGGEFALRDAAFNALHDKGGATYEGFSSPLNCHVSCRPDVKFCSLFNDTDSAFGSLGNFFRIDLADHPGGWILHPPFVELVMEATAHRVVEHLRTVTPGSIWFFVVFPRWKDTPGWDILNQSEYKEDRIDFKKGQITFNQCIGESFTARPKTSIFTIGKPPQRVSLSDLQDTTMADGACGGNSSSD